MDIFKSQRKAYLKILGKRVEDDIKNNRIKIIKETQWEKQKRLNEEASKVFNKVIWGPDL